MASTKPPVEALDYVKIFIKRMPLDQVFTEAVNRVASIMWMYAPWRWTVGSTPTFALTAATQNYTITYPADWLFALRAQSTDGTLTEPMLEIVPVIETVSGYVGLPKQIAYVGSAGGSGNVQISPVPAEISGTLTVNGLYKKVMPLYTNETIYTGVMPFPDEWFWVFEEGLLWLAYQYGDDRRAGDASVDKDSGKIQFTGQRANFEAAMIQMREREPLLLVNPLNADQKDWKK